MQKEDGNENLLRSNTRNQRQQIEPRRDIENRGVGDEILAGECGQKWKPCLILSETCSCVQQAQVAATSQKRVQESSMHTGRNQYHPAIKTHSSAILSGGPGG
jgi:hypothetical protein